jgi:hypothetical protein
MKLKALADIVQRINGWFSRQNNTMVMYILPVPVPVPVPQDDERLNKGRSVKMPILIIFLKTIFFFFSSCF